MHRDAETETEMETMMEELPDLSVGGVVCKHYEEPGVAGGAAHFFSGGANNVEFTTAEETTEATGGALVSRYNGNLKCQCDLLFCNPNPTDNHFASAVELQVDKESSTIVGNKEVPTNVKRFKCKKCAYGQ